MTPFSKSELRPFISTLAISTEKHIDSTISDTIQQIWIMAFYIHPCYLYRKTHWFYNQWHHSANLNYGLLYTPLPSLQKNTLILQSVTPFSKSELRPFYIHPCHLYRKTHTITTHMPVLVVFLSTVKAFFKPMIPCFYVMGFNGELVLAHKRINTFLLYVWISYSNQLSNNDAELCINCKQKHHWTFYRLQTKMLLTNPVNDGDRYWWFLSRVKGMDI